MRKVEKTPARNREAAKRPAQRGATSVANDLAQKLQQAIDSGDVAVGSALPSERELTTKYQVSRATVREALRMLSARDQIQVKRGRSGGSFVSTPSSQSAMRSLDSFIKSQSIRYNDLVFAREAIEPAAAAQAALTRTEEKLHALWLLCVECEQNIQDFDGFVQANLKWHLALAEASNNPLFVAFLTSISNSLHDATDLEEFDLRIRKAVVGIHWQIYDAIRLQDPEAARRRMDRHLSAYRDRLTLIDVGAEEEGTDQSASEPGNDAD